MTSLPSIFNKKIVSGYMIKPLINNLNKYLNWTITIFILRYSAVINSNNGENTTIHLAGLLKLTGYFCPVQHGSWFALFFKNSEFKRNYNDRTKYVCTIPGANNLFSCDIYDKKQRIQITNVKSITLWNTTAIK